MCAWSIFLVVFVFLYFSLGGFFFGWRCQLLRPWSALFFGSWMTRIPSENFFTSYCVLHFVFIIVFLFVSFYYFVYFILIRGDLAEPHISYMFCPLIYFILLDGRGSYIQKCSPRMTLIYSDFPMRATNLSLMSLASSKSSAEVIICFGSSRICLSAIRSHFVFFLTFGLVPLLAVGGGGASGVLCWVSGCR